MARNINTCRGSWVDRRICSRRHGSRLVDSRLVNSRLVDSRVVGGILLGSHLDWRSLIWSRLWKWRDERQRLSHRACQKFVHTNFVSEQLNENLYNKLQNSLTSSRMWIQSLDVLHNERPLILHFENFDARFVTWSCTNDLQLLRESDRFNSSSLRALDCLDTCTASGLLLHLERFPSMNYLSSLFIELRKEVFEEDSNSSSFEFKIKDNLSLI